MPGSPAIRTTFPRPASASSSAPLSAASSRSRPTNTPRAGSATGCSDGADVECRVLHQDLLVQFAQPVAGLDAELVDQGPASLAVGGERIGLATRAVEGKHQLLAQPLAHRVIPYQRFEFGDDAPRGGPAAGSPRSDPRAPRRAAPPAVAISLCRKDSNARSPSGGPAPQCKGLVDLAPRPWPHRPRPSPPVQPQLDPRSGGDRADHAPAVARTRVGGSTATPSSAPASGPAQGHVAGGTPLPAVLFGASFGCSSPHRSSIS